MKVLVTGARGFIGSRLMHGLEREGHGPVGLGRGAGQKDLPWVRHVLGTGDRPILPRGTDTVVHLAFAHPSLGADESNLHRVNVEGTREMVEAAVAAGTQRFVLASTGGVYGYRDRPSIETDRPAPADIYSRTKEQAEAVALRHRHDLQVVILRLFFPYGRGQTGRLVPGLVDRVLEGRPIPVHPEGRPRVNPVHVDDLVAVILRCLTLDDHQILNVAGPEVTDIPGLATWIARLSGRDVSFEETLPPVADLLGDTDRLEHVLGMRPRRALREGLRGIVEDRLAAEAA